MIGTFTEKAYAKHREARIRRFSRLIIGAIVVGGALATGSAVAAEEMNRMTLTGSGHGILMDDKAREAAGVPKEIADYIWGMQEQLSTWRRDLHKIPELGMKETNTHAYLVKVLEEMGYKPQKIGTAGTGIIVDIPGEDTSFRIGVRGDIDGLPITEVDGREYGSTIKGQMHACGHDNHTTVVLGVAKAYADGKFKPPANLRLIFQPAEEVGLGALDLIKHGVLEGVDVIIGLHSDPTREWGRIGLTDGTWSSFATGFTFEITGKAAHAGVAHHEGN